LKHWQAARLCLFFFCWEGGKRRLQSQRPARTNTAIALEFPMKKTIVSLLGLLVVASLAFSIAKAQEKSAAYPERFLDLLKVGDTVRLTEGNPGHRVTIYSPSLALKRQEEWKKNAEEYRTLQTEIKELGPSVFSKDKDNYARHQLISSRLNELRGNTDYRSFGTITFVGNDYIGIDEQGYETFIAQRNISSIRRAKEPAEKD
jgi:hypothetical protein